MLTPHEPRLVRKLVPPLTELINTTPAMSLLYECIQTSIVGGMLTDGREGDALAATCVDKLSAFLTDADQNCENYPPCPLCARPPRQSKLILLLIYQTVRYIALVALVKILPSHPHLLSPHHDTILACVDDPDMSIRLRALDLVEGMVDRSTLRPIVTRLMIHLRPSASAPASAASHLAAQQAAKGPAAPLAVPAVLSAAYRGSLIALILRVCAQATYGLVTNFQWYLDVLVELAHLALGLGAEGGAGEEGVLGGGSGVSVGTKVRDQLVDVTARVKAIRPYAVQKMASLLEDESFLEGGDGADGAAVLGAAAWICGEYCRELVDPRPVIAALFGSSTSGTLPPKILASYAHNGVKVYAAWLAALADNWDEADLAQIRSVTGALEAQLAVCAGSDDVELQERGAELGQALELVRRGLDAPRPVPASAGGFGSERLADEADELGSLDAPALAPACLGVLGACFFSHELNPVNPKAQGMVGVPDGLDLEEEIVAGSSREWYAVRDAGEGEGTGAREVDEFGRPTGRAVAAAAEQARLAGANGRKKKGVAKGSKKGKGREVEDDPEELAKVSLDGAVPVGQSCKVANACFSRVAVFAAQSGSPGTPAGRPLLRRPLARPARPSRRRRRRLDPDRRPLARLWGARTRTPAAARADAAAGVCRGGRGDAGGTVEGGGDAACDCGGGGGGEGGRGGGGGGGGGGGRGGGGEGGEGGEEEEEGGGGEGEEEEEGQAGRAGMSELFAGARLAGGRGGGGLVMRRLPFQLGTFAPVASTRCWTRRVPPYLRQEPAGLRHPGLARYPSYTGSLHWDYYTSTHTSLVVSCATNATVA